jgi:hypothetical protein
VVWRGVGAGDSKTKNKEDTTGGGFIAYHVPHFSLFQAHPLPLDNNNCFTWIFSNGAKNVLGTKKTFVYTVPRQGNHQASVLASLVLFADFHDFCSSMTQNYRFLTSAGHNIPELTRIDKFSAGHNIPELTRIAISLPLFKAGLNSTRTSSVDVQTLLSINEPVPLSNNIS